MKEGHYCDEHEIKFPNFKGELWHIKEIHQNTSREELEKVYEY